MTDTDITALVERLRKVDEDIPISLHDMIEEAADALGSFEARMARIEAKLDTAIAGMTLLGEHLRELAEKVLNSEMTPS